MTYRCEHCGGEFATSRAFRKHRADPYGVHAAAAAASAREPVCTCNPSNEASWHADDCELGGQRIADVADQAIAIARRMEDERELEKVKAFAKERGLELVDTTMIDTTLRSVAAIERDNDSGRAKLAELARRVRSLAMFQMDGLDLPSAPRGDERRRFLEALYAIANELEDLR